MQKVIEHEFEKSFLQRSIDEQTVGLDTYPLASLFIELFQESQPVLEAGCGSGRWCKWFSQHGIRSDGVDWSEELCERARQAIPESRFYACDVQEMPLEDSSYGGLIALGTIEHILHGPQQALKEFHRVLRPGGLAIITVPYGGSLRRLARLLVRPFRFLKANPFLRRLLGKPAAGTVPFSEVARNAVSDWMPEFSVNEVGWYFFQYEFNRAQMDQFLRNANFNIIRAFVEFKEQGILVTFGPLAGKFSSTDPNQGLNILGRFLSWLLPSSLSGHMLCYIIQKPL